MVIRFTVPGEPTGKGRPRVFKANGVSRAVTPQKTLSYENLVKWIVSELMQVKQLTGEVEAEIKAYYAIPKSMTKKNRQLIEEGKLHPTKKPDLDNVAKIILDALNGIAYKDDSQVVRLHVEKEYADDNKPRVEVVLRELEEKSRIHRSIG